MEEARNLTNAERCSLFLVDDDARELIAKVFDGIESEVCFQKQLPVNTFLSLSTKFYDN